MTSICRVLTFAGFTFAALVITGCSGNSSKNANPANLKSEPTSGVTLGERSAAIASSQWLKKAEVQYANGNGTVPALAADWSWAFTWRPATNQSVDPLSGKVLASKQHEQIGYEDNIFTSSADSKRLVTHLMYRTPGHQLHRFRVWDPSQLKVLNEFQIEDSRSEHLGDRISFRVNHDGSKLAVIAYNITDDPSVPKLLVIDTSNGAILKRIPINGHRSVDWISGYALDHQGDFLAVALARGEIQTFDLTNDTSATFTIGKRCNGGNGSNVQISANGTVISLFQQCATTEEGQVGEKLAILNSGKLKTLEQNFLHSGYKLGGVSSDASQVFYIVNDYGKKQAEIQAVDTVSGQIVDRLNPNMGFVSDIIMSADNSKMAIRSLDWNKVFYFQR